MPVNPDEQKSLTTWTVVVVFGAIAAEVLQTLLVGKPYSLGFLPKNSWVDFLYFMGAFSGVPASVLWIGRREIPRLRKAQVLAVLIGCILYAYQLVFNDGEGLYAPASIICFVLGPLGLLALVSALVFVRNPKFSESKDWAILFLKICVLLDALSVATAAGLANNRLIFPATWDYIVYKIDVAYGVAASGPAIYFYDANPFIKALTAAIYGVLIFCFYALVGLAIRKNATLRLNVWRTLTVPFALAFLIYALLPVSGPTYAFFSGEFPLSLPAPGTLPTSPVVIPPAYRNGMPSMHFTGALLVWMLAVALRERVAVLMSTFLVIGTAWATLAIGEHYLVDLVVALPYAAFLGPLLIWPERFKSSASISIPVWGAAIIFFSWVILLRVAPSWLVAQIEFVQVLSVASIAVSLIVFWQIFKENLVEKTPARLAIRDSAEVQKTKSPRWIIAAFFVSGIAGLIYEVVYAKALAVTFGSTALASYTVLATYMGGIAFGAWLGGYFADRVKNPLKAYALCEAFIGIYAALTPLIFTFIQSVYVHFGMDSPPDAAWLTPFRLTLGILSLGIPTTMMGATLPLMFKHLKSIGISSDKAIAPLYAANVVGAAVGSVVAGYFLLPAVGRNGGTFIAAIVSLLLALYVLEKQKSVVLPAISKEVFTNKKVPPALFDRPNKRYGLAALSVLFVGGGVTLGLEVSSMHLLAIVAGNSVYAFGLMLATFLAGLGLGSFVGEKLMGRYSKLALIGVAQCGIAIAVALTAQMWGDLPSYFSSFSLYPVKLSFSAREAIRALVCLCAMLPPAFFIGLSYPAAMDLATEWLSPTGGAKGVGIASAFNTLGNILGVLLVGFWLLPSYGSRNAVFGLALVALALGLISLALSQQQTNARKSVASYSINFSPALLALVCIFLFPRQWNFDDLSSGSNVYFSAQDWGKVIDHSESVEGGLTSVAKNANGVLTLLTNGKFQGNDSPGGEMVAQESFALFPLLHTPQRASALVIGYGTGMTTRSLHEFGFKNIEVAELSKDIVALADKYFRSINSAISTASGVSLHYTDGRNFLLTQSKKFDVISIEITSIWFAGAANLYNREFYALAKRRLNHDGVIQQWIQLHHISTTDLIYAIGSIRSEFKYVWIYVRGGQGIIVASNSEKALDLPGKPQLEKMAVVGKEELSPEKLASHMLLSPAGVDNMISSFDPTMEHLTSTDQNLYLEHSTPKGNALGDVVGENISILSGFEPVAKDSGTSANKVRAH